MGFGVWGLGFGVWGLGFGVWGLGIRGPTNECHLLAASRKLLEQGGGQTVVMIGARRLHVRVVVIEAEIARAQSMAEISGDAAVIDAVNRALAPPPNQEDPQDTPSVDTQLL